MSKAKAKATPTQNGQPKAGLCQATRKDGQPCTNSARPGSLYCFGHNPEFRRAALEGSKKAAKAKAAGSPRRRIDMAKLTSSLEKAIVDVLEGRLDAKIAQAAGSLAGALVKCLEAGELASRLSEVEDKVKSLAWRRY